MVSELLSRFSALAAHEKHRADRALEEALGSLYADLSSKGTYHGSANVFLTKKALVEILAHLFRLTRLRRANNSALAPIRSLAYYRTVLDSLTPDDLEPSFIALVAHRAD